MDTIFKEENNIFEKQLRDAFKPAVAQQSDLFRAVALVFYHNEKLSDIYDIYKLLGIEDFVRLIHLLDGRTVNLPTSTELKDVIILSLCFYYREVEKLGWEEVHERIPFKFSSLQVSHKIKSLNSALKKELATFLKEQLDNEKEEKNE